MKFIWFGLFIAILILALIKPFIVNFESVAVIAISLHVTYTMMVLMSHKNKIKGIYLGAFFARIAFMVWDLYARHIFLFPNSGMDSEMFYENTVLISTNWLPGNGTLGFRGGIYSQLRLKNTM